MSNKNTIAHAAAAITELETALEATRQAHTAPTTHIETKIEAFAEVVRNTRRKMHTPNGFEWALHKGFKVVGITDAHLKVQATKGRTEQVTLTIPRSDLSLSTWQITGLIRRMSAEAFLDNLATAVNTNKKTVTQHRKEVTAAQNRLHASDKALAAAQHRVDRRIERTQKVEAKRAAARARRKARAQGTAQAETTAQADAKDLVAV